MYGSEEVGEVVETMAVATAVGGDGDGGEDAEDGGDGETGEDSDDGGGGDDGDSGNGEHGDNDDRYGGTWLEMRTDAAEGEENDEGGEDGRTWWDMALGDIVQTVVDAVGSVALSVCGTVQELVGLVSSVGVRLGVGVQESFK